MSEKRGGGTFGNLRAVALLSGIGLTLALSVGVGIGLGLLVDHYFHTRNWGVIIGAVVGVAAGFQQMIKTVIQANEEQERADAEARRNADQR
jgi:F0F1-type ATP synthase assembly protein I